MNATHRLDFLLTGVLKNPPNGISQESSMPPSSKLTFSEHKSCPSTKVSSAITTTTATVPLPPRRDSSSIKHHHHRPHRITQTDKPKVDQPLLNSSTLDDLFRALTLECEQYLAATSSYQHKTYAPIIVQPSSTKQTAVESNDEDYENLHTIQPPIKTNISPLKTSIEVISPIKRHVVSITVSSKISSSLSKPPPSNITTPTIRHSSEENVVNTSPSSTNRKRRRRTRKQIILSSTTRSSSSSNERKEITTEKKPIISKRSCSTDHRYHRHKNTYDNHLLSIPSHQKPLTKRPHRRDISLQHFRSNGGRLNENYSSPLSVLLTSTKGTSDFLDNSHQRRSRIESIDHKPTTLLNRIHEQFYRPASTRNNHNHNHNNNNNNNNIPIHRIPSYPVY